MKIRRKAKSKVHRKLAWSPQFQHETMEELEQRLIKYAELTRGQFLARVEATRAYEAAHPEILDITVLAGPIRRNPRFRGNS
jgi:hypothetical protein